MRRYHQEEQLLISRARRERDLVGRRASDLGRYRKKHPLDCGNARCHLCHSDKVPKRTLTRQEKAAAIRQQEQ